MANSSDSNRDKLEAAAVEAHAWVQHYLDEIAGRIADVPSPDSDGYNWGHVGNLQKVKEDLRQIVKRIVRPHRHAKIPAPIDCSPARSIIAPTRNTSTGC